MKTWQNEKFSNFQEEEEEEEEDEEVEEVKEEMEEEQEECKKMFSAKIHTCKRYCIHQQLMADKQGALKSLQFQIETKTHTCSASLAGRYCNC